MTTINMGATPKHNTYHIGSWHGTGLTCVNILSIWCEALVERDGRIYKLHCEQGISTEPLQHIGETDGHGTTISWLPDPEIFGEHKYSADIIRRYIRNTCYLTPEATIHFHNHLNWSDPEVFQFKRGVADLAESLEEYQKPIGKIIHLRETLDNVLVDLALQFTATAETRILTFANHVHTDNGGSHLRGLQSGVRRAVSAYAQKIENVNGDARYFSYNDISKGIVAVVSVRVLQAWFEGATRSKLGNEEVAGIVDLVVRKAIGEYFERHAEVGRTIVERAAAAQLERRAKAT